jgi:hypothetical protein
MLGTIARPAGWLDGWMAGWLDGWMDDIIIIIIVWLRSAGLYRW